MDNKQELWVRGHSVCWCPRCLVTVDPEQTHCLVCGYCKDVTDINVGHTGHDDNDCSGLLEED